MPTIFFGFQSSCAQTTYHTPWYVAGVEEKTLPIPPQGGQYLHSTYNSNLLNQDIGFVIYLPPTYFGQPTKKFPLIVDLHGAETAYFDYAFWTGHYYTEAMQIGTLPEAIVVFPNGLCGPWNDTLQGGAYWLDYYDPGVGYPGKVETTIITELLPYLEMAYRVGTKKENKAIVGFSMGGYGAVRYAILSQKFGSCTSLDGALRKKENVSISETYMRANNKNFALAQANSIYNIYSDNREKAKNIPFYLITAEGSNWPNVNWAPDAQELANMMTADGITNTYEYIPGIDHDHSAFWDLRKTQIFSFIRSYLVLPTGKNQ